MSAKPSPFSAGLSSAFSYPRLAGVLWLALALPGVLVYVAMKGAAAPFDEGPFREVILEGWSSWAIASWIGFKGREISAATPVVLLSLGLFVALHLFVTAGLLRVLVVGIRRPVLRRVIAEGASLFRPTVWATVRFAVTLLFWEGLLVGLPVAILEKVAGDEAPPNNAWATAAELWTIVVGLLVLFNVVARYDLARIALAKDDAPTARGAYRVAKERLRGGRAGAVALLLAWLLVSGLVQTLFTNLGIRMSPGTGAGLFGLVLMRQLGFFLLAMTRVGFWGSLLAWEEARRPVPLPIPVWQPRVAEERPPAVAKVEPEPAPVTDPEHSPLPATEPPGEQRAG